MYPSTLSPTIMFQRYVGSLPHGRFRWSYGDLKPWYSTLREEKVSSLYDVKSRHFCYEHWPKRPRTKTSSCWWFLQLPPWTWKTCFGKGIYDPGSRFATTPPPPHGMVPKLAFCSIPHENVVFAVFFAWWVAGAVRNPANSLDFCNQPSENVLFAMFRLRHRGVVPPRPLLFLCQIIT